MTTRCALASPCTLPSPAVHRPAQGDAPTRTFRLHDLLCEPAGTSVVQIHDDAKLQATAISFAGSQALRDLFKLHWDHRAVDLQDDEKGVTRLKCPSAGDLREILALAVEELTSSAFKCDWLRAICAGMSVAFGKDWAKVALVDALRRVP